MKNSDVIEQLSMDQVATSLTNNRIFLTDSDIDVLINTYNELINKTSEKWNNIVNYFEDIKVEYIQNGAIEYNSYDILQEVLREIGEVESEINKDQILTQREDIEEFLNIDME